MVWTLQTVVFVLYGQVGESVCKPIKSGISIPYSPLVLLDISTVDLQSQMFWGLIVPVQVLQDGKPSVGLRSLLFEEDLHL